MIKGDFKFLTTDHPMIVFEDTAVGHLKKKIFDASEAEIDEILKEYEHPLRKAYKPPTREAIRGHGGGQRGTPFSWHRLMLALREDRITDFDVYDSVTSSAIIPLTEASVAKNSEPIDFPDFTKGQWKERLPVEVAYHKESA